MPSFSDTKCGQQLTQAAQGVLKPEELKQIFDNIDARKGQERLKKIVDDVTGKFIDQKHYEAQAAKRTTILNKAAVKKLQNHVNDYVKKGLSPAKAYEAVALGTSGHAGVGTRDNAASMRSTIVDREIGRVAGALKRERLTKIATSPDFGASIREARYALNTPKENRVAGDTPNLDAHPAPIKAQVEQVAKILNDSTERMRTLANDKGALIGKREAYAGAQSHDSYKIRNAADPKKFRLIARTTERDHRVYVNDLARLIDVNKTRSNLVRLGRLGVLEDLDPHQFLNRLADIFQGGTRKDARAGAELGGSNLASEAEKARILDFKSPGAQHEYDTKYGSGSVFQSHLDQIHHLGHTAAGLEYFGPSAKENFDTAYKQKQIELGKKKEDLRNAGIKLPVDKDGSLADGSVNDKTVTGDNRARAGDEAGARGGDPEAGANLLRESIGAGNEERGSEGQVRPDDSGIRQERGSDQSSTVESERQSEIVDAYRKLATRLGKDLKGTGLPADATPLNEGAEHQVYKSGDRVYKVLKGPEDFGIDPEGASNPLTYLERLNLANKVFGDDIKWEGINEFGQTVTSQPFIKGEAPTVSETNAFMRSKGFEPQHPETKTEATARKLGAEQPITSWQRDDIKVEDAQYFNFIKDETGKIRPIDLAISSTADRNIGAQPPATPALPAAPANPYASLTPEQRETAIDQIQKHIDELNSSPASQYLDKFLGGHLEPGNMTQAKIVDNIMSIQRMSLLGGSFFSNIPTFWTSALQSDYAGVNLLKASFRSIFGLMERAGKGDMETWARQTGVGNQGLLGQFASMMTDGSNGGKPGDMMKNFQSKFFKVVGLTGLKDMVGNNYTFMVSNEIAHNAGKSFDELPGNMQRHFHDYRISPQEWDIIRSHGVMDANGYQMIASDKLQEAPVEKFQGIGGAVTPNAMAGARTQLELKMANLFHDSASYATVEPDLKTQMLTPFTNGTKGTISGDLGRLTMQFSTWGFAHGVKVIQRQATANSFPASVGKLGAGLLLTGMFSYVARQVAQGKNPLANPDLYGDDHAKASEAWAKMLMLGAGQSGIGGMFGDLLFSQTYANGRGSPLQMLGGPLTDNVTQAAQFAYDGLLKGKADSVQMLKYAQGNTPFINTWWIKPIINYLFMYGLQEHLNPGSLQRMERASARAGNPYYAPPSQYAVSAPPRRI